MTNRIRRCGQHACIYAMLRQELLDDMLTARLGDYRWDVDLGAQRFTFSSPSGTVTATAHLLASIAAKPATLMWGFAPSFTQYGPAVALSAGVRQVGQAQGLAQFTDYEVAYPVPLGADQGEVIASLAHDVGALGVELFGSSYCYYSMPIGGGSRAVVLLGDLSHPLPEVTLAEVFSRLPRYLTGVDDPAWSLDGLVRLCPGWTITQGRDATGAHHARITDQAGRTASVEYRTDEYGRLREMNLHHDGDPAPGRGTTA